MEGKCRINGYCIKSVAPYIYVLDFYVDFPKDKDALTEEFEKFLKNSDENTEKALETNRAEYKRV